MEEYSYQLPYTEIKRCPICGKWIEYKPFVFKRTHMHKDCFMKLLTKWEIYSLSCILI